MFREFLDVIDLSGLRRKVKSPRYYFGKPPEIYKTDHETLMVELTPVVSKKSIEVNH